MSIRSEMALLEPVFQAAVVMAMVEHGAPPWGEWGEVIVGPFYEPPDMCAIWATVTFAGSAHPDCSCHSATAVAFTFDDLYLRRHSLEDLVRARAMFAVQAACEEWIAHQDPKTAARRHAEQAADLIRQTEEDR